MKHELLLKVFIALLCWNLNPIAPFIANASTLAGSSGYYHFDDEVSCIEPPAWSQCTPPASGYDKNLVATGNVTWNSLVGTSNGYQSDNMTRKVRITGAGTLTVTNGEL